MRDPFGVEDVPDARGLDVIDFADRTVLTGSADDPDAPAWGDTTKDRRAIEGSFVLGLD